MFEIPVIVTFHYLVGHSIGRFNRDYLFQATLMHHFIEEIKNRAEICGCTEDLNDLEDWEGVTFNAKNEVINSKLLYEV